MKRLLGLLFLITVFVMDSNCLIKTKQREELDLAFEMREKAKRAVSPFEYGIYRLSEDLYNGSARLLEYGPNALPFRDTVRRTVSGMMELIRIHGELIQQHEKLSKKELQDLGYIAKRAYTQRELRDAAERLDREQAERGSQRPSRGTEGGVDIAGILTETQPPLEY